MPRATWTGAISFGLVNVPVKLYTAVSKKTVRFNQLHATDGARIQQRRICPADDEEVPYEHIVKGYEIAPDEYVVVSPEELEALEPPRTKTIEVKDFVPAEEVDPIYFDASYYVLPDRGSAKPYDLLLEAMRGSGKVAIGRVVIRTKEKLVALRASGDMLMLATMNFADEVVSPSSLDATSDQAARASERELNMARQLVESLSDEFDPTQYQDTYRERVLDLIERKAKGEEVVLQQPEQPREAPDLMAALEASVKAAQSGKRPAGAKRRRGDDGQAAPRRSRAGAKKS